MAGDKTSPEHNMDLLLLIPYMIVGMLLAGLLEGITKKLSIFPNKDWAWIWVPAWPFCLSFLISYWILEQTAWYKRRKWRKRLRITVSEENEPDESFLRRSKRL